MSISLLTSIFITGASATGSSKVALIHNVSASFTCIVVPVLIQASFEYVKVATGAVLSIVKVLEVTTVVFQARSVAVILSVAVVVLSFGTVQV